MEDFLTVRETADNFEACRLYTRTYAKSFYFASFVLPREKRNAAYALYAFCRYADNLIDEASAEGETDRRRERLSELRDQVRYAYRHSPLMNPKLRAFQETVFRYRIPQEHLIDLLRGVEMDITIGTYPDYSALRDYCYCVASVVGLMMMRILGARDERAAQPASDLGLAMQLTNILRDVGEDLRRDRVYLPQDELDRFGVSRDDLRRGEVSPGFRALMKFQISRARELYRSAEKGIPYLDADGSRYCVRLMAGTYGKILEAIETNNYDVFTRRAAVGTPAKFGIAAGLLLHRSLPVTRETGPSTFIALTSK